MDAFIVIVMIDSEDYALGTTFNPLWFVLARLVERIQGILSDEQSWVHKLLERLIPPIQQGKFSSFRTLWRWIQGEILSIHQIVDDIDGNVWTSPLLSAIVKLLLDHFNIQDALDGYATMPFLKLVVSCISTFLLAINPGNPQS